MSINVIDLDFDSPQQVAQWLKILSTYSQEAGGGNQEIATAALEKLPGMLKGLANSHVLLAMNHDQAVGAAVCLGGFSTFKAQPVLNVHDLAVLPAHRGKGIGTALLDAAEARARELGCCKVTLEVIESNEGARRLYGRQGFESPSTNLATYFLEKPLS